MSDARVVLVATGGANIASLQYALDRLGVAAPVTADAASIRAASHVILPGVGAAGNAMERLRQGGLVEVVRELRQPVLGICLGMQLLFDTSAEGDTACLGAIPGAASRFTCGPGLPVPHMGWNSLDILADSPLLAGIAPGEHAYFVHSYALPVSAATTASTDYGGPFSASVSWHNFHGTQFHPERSAGVGARVLSNFLKLCS